MQGAAHVCKRPDGLMANREAQLSSKKSRQCQGSDSSRVVNGRARLRAASQHGCRANDEVKLIPRFGRFGTKISVKGQYNESGNRDG